MTIGQLSFYDQVKLYLLASGYFDDNIITHFTASTTAVSKMLLSMLLKKSLENDLHSLKHSCFIGSSSHNIMSTP